MTEEKKEPEGFIWLSDVRHDCNLSILAQRDIRTRRISLHLGIEDFRNETYEVQDVALKPFSSGLIRRATPINITYDVAQELMDDLWNCGIRPQSTDHIDKHIVALEKHLTDMRVLVFEGRNIKLPKGPVRFIREDGSSE